MTVIRWSLNIVLIMLAFCSAMRAWQYHVLGIRLTIYDILLLVLISLFAAHAITRRQLKKPPKSLLALIQGMALIAMLSGLSIVLLDFSLAPKSLEQFAKVLLTIGAYFTGLAAMILHLASEPPKFAERVLRAYILGAVASSVYSFAEVSSAYYGYDLGKAIFGALSSYGPSDDPDRAQYYKWDIFFRAVGFTGANAQATYVASVVPLLLFAQPFRSSRNNLFLAAICLAGLALTLSRTGFFSLFVALGVLMFTHPNWFARNLPRMLIASLPLIAVGVVFYEEAATLLGTRIYSSLEDFNVGRRELYVPIMDAVLTHPFGHGIGQYYVVSQWTNKIDFGTLALVEDYMSEQELRDAYANLHNNWLNWLFEGGWPLLFAYVLYYGLALRACWRANSRLGYVAACVLTGLLASGWFNNSLDLFSTQLLFVLLPCVAVFTARARSQSVPRIVRTQGVDIPEGPPVTRA